MRIKNLWPYLWKTLLLGIALFLGATIGDYLATQTGLERPAGLTVFSAFALALSLLAISPILLASALFLCRLGTGNYLVHWLTLSFLTWAVYSLVTRVRGGPQNTLLDLSPYLIIILFFTSFIGIGVAVLMFPEHYKRREDLLVGR